MDYYIYDAEELGYNPARAESIERYAQGLIGLTIREAVEEYAVEAKRNKGNLGQLIEKGFFGYDKPARTMLTSEGSFNRSTHIVRDKKTGRIRLLTPIEAERIQGFPDDWTKECLVNGEIIEMPLNKRRFMMGNALVVNLIAQMERQLSEIFNNE